MENDQHFASLDLVAAGHFLPGGHGRYRICGRCSIVPFSVLPHVPCLLLGSLVNARTSHAHLT